MSNIIMLVEDNTLQATPMIRQLKNYFEIKEFCIIQITEHSDLPKFDENLTYLLCCHNGKLAADFYTRHATSVHLIIMDYAMPVMNGDDALKKMMPSMPRKSDTVSDGKAKLGIILNSGGRENNQTMRSILNIPGLHIVSISAGKPWTLKYLSEQLVPEMESQGWQAESLNKRRLSMPALFRSGRDSSSPPSTSIFQGITASTPNEDRFLSDFDDRVSSARGSSSNYRSSSSEDNDRDPSPSLKG